MPTLPLHTASITPRLLDSLVTANASTGTIQAVCAWPVSGQYGPGTRILYYVLVAACVFGRGSEWLRGACLAAALLLPAVAALHGIVLAAVHVDTAVDMDIYGAFQLCAIGILAGPATVKMSKTYFNTPGRNLIFLWTGLVLSGLLSLTIESFRTNSRSCPASGFANGLDSDFCGFSPCDQVNGPFSPLRGGSQNNIYIIQAPHALTFGTMTLLAAACCIYAILQMVSMWNTILKLNWKKRFGEKEDNDLDLPGPDALSTKTMRNVNDMIRFYLQMIEIPLFSAAVMAILIVGEMNFFSPSVVYMSEPMASVGQWAPIVGTGLAAMGSLYALLAAGEAEGSEKGSLQVAPGCCTCSHHHQSGNGSVKSSLRPPTPDGKEEDEGEYEAETQHVEDRSESRTARRLTIDTVALSHQSSRLRHIRTVETTADVDLQTWTTAGTVDSGNRRKVARTFKWFGDVLGTPAPETYDDSDFQDGLAADFPTIPGEETRNPALAEIMKAYNPRRDMDGHVTPNNIPRPSRSRAGSCNGSIVSGLGIEGVSEAASVDSEAVAGPSRPPEQMLKKRRSTLDVPKPVYFGSRLHRQSSLSSDTAADMTVDADETPQGPTSPTITVSPDLEM
ncbi:hypothetical protein BD289DRAFT_461078 [Coniella lustricola]|uniref:Uncharacterized protein n=1 Tax=Coniella lustricola TaxID=2025994 RepID=A0A2T3A720_9PEZI|nr:hypothetical protein BD289DRAFT_461078 [Coniella lustricola]